MEKRILLVCPPLEGLKKGYLPPLGLGYLAAVLENAGHEVKIFDTPVLDLGVEKTIKEIKNFNPDILGITSASLERFNAIKIIQGIQELNCLKILGGPHFSATDIDALQNIPADLVVRNEGEKTLLEIANGNKKLKEIYGITFRKGNKIIRTLDRPFLDLDDLPFPARHLFPISKYKTKLEGEYKTKCLSIISSRGCPNQCIFCFNRFFWKQHFRKRTPQSVVDEIEEIISTYNIYGLDFWDDTLTTNQDHVEKICEEILKRKLDIKWYARIRVNTVNKDILKLMKKAGCIAVSFGVESGSQRILKVIKKNITLDQVRRVARICNDLRFHTKVFFMFNHPTETINDIKLSLKFMGELKNYPNILTMEAITNIYPGTEIEQIAKEKGILPKNFSWNSPFFSEKNKKYHLDPFVPYFEQIKFRRLMTILRRWEKISKIRTGIKGLKNVRNIGDLKILCKHSVDMFKNYR